jgi:ribulose-bisphosphate carboxylase large chain
MTSKTNISGKQTAAVTQQKYNAPSCDWKAPQSLELRVQSSELIKNKDRIYRYKGNFRWSGVKTERYKQKNEGWSDIARNVLIGSHGETAKFHFRYFEIAPNGYSSLERHKHEHVVVCIRGNGKVLTGKKAHAIGYLDTVYIAPNTVHQLSNPYDEPFGFFCIVNARRDRPKEVKKLRG